MTATPYQEIQGKISKAYDASLLQGDNLPKLIAVSKGQTTDKITDLLAQGHRIFGENKVQEATQKYPQLRAEYSDIELHFIGHLQSNKATEAVALFDVIQTIDREKIAKTLAKEMQKQGRNLPCFIQINIGEEPQKSGISPLQTREFTHYCTADLGLNIVGYMCVPPAGEPSASYFGLMHKLAKENNITELSMGMSRDFESAITFGATYVRVGTALFGERAAV